MPTIIPTPAPVPDPLSSNFGTLAYAFTQWMASAAPAMNSLSTELNAALNLSLLGVTTSSTTSLTIATGAQSLTVGTGLGIAVGMPLKLTRTSDVTKYMKGTVTSYNSGTGALNLTVATINGSGTFTDWTIAFDIPDAPAAPGLVLLETVTASASATVSIETGFSSTYDDYLLIVSNFSLASSSATLNCLLKFAGAYAASGYSHNRLVADNAFSGQTVPSDTLIEIITGVNSALTTTANFRVYIQNVNSTTKAKSIDWDGVFPTTQATAASRKSIGAGSNTAITALQGIRFQMSSGNIATGTFKLYGIRKT